MTMAVTPVAAALTDVFRARSWRALGGDIRAPWDTLSGARMVRRR